MESISSQDEEIHFLRRWAQAPDRPQPFVALKIGRDLQLVVYDVAQAAALGFRAAPGYSDSWMINDQSTQRRKRMCSSVGRKLFRHLRELGLGTEITFIDIPHFTQQPEEKTF